MMSDKFDIFVKANAADITRTDGGGNGGRGERNDDDDDDDNVSVL